MLITTPPPPEGSSGKDSLLKSYDGRHFVRTDVHLDDDLLMLWDHEPPPPTFPIPRAYLIVEGKLTTAKSVLSNDKGFVFTVYKLEVTKVFKNNGSDLISPREAIFVTASGGGVRYGKEKKVVYLLAGRNLPAVDKEYLLFLDKPIGQHHPVISGYHLSKGKVVPLDLRVAFHGLSGKGRKYFNDIVDSRVKGYLQRSQKGKE